jgi:hypothetical protein
MITRRHQKLFPVFLLPFVLLLASQTGSANFSNLEPEKFYRTELYFGMDIPGGGEVSEEDWNKFLADEVTSRFPQGFTVLPGYGQFKDSRGEIERENSRVLILFYPKKTRSGVSKKIEEIRAAYKKQFRQESVLRLDYVKSVEVSF